MNDAAPRNMDLAASAYLKAVDAIMSQQYGVTYFDVHQDIHKDLEKLKGACAKQLSPEEFVKQAASDAGFKPITAGFGAQDAKAHNARQAALIGYAHENPNWQVGEDGIYSDAKGGVVRFHPQYDSKRSRWEFGLSVGEGGFLSGGPSKPKQESFFLEFITSAQDIGDSLELLAEMKPEYADFGPQPEPDSSPGTGMGF